MKYTTIDPMELDSERMQRGEGFEIKGCMKNTSLCLSRIAQKYL